MSKPLKVFFIGRKHGILSFKNIPVPKFMPWHIENERPGERLGFNNSENVVRTRRISRADIIFVRNMPEKTTARTYARIKKKVERFRYGRLIVNEVDAFPNYSGKDRSFTIWQANGIRCPAYIELDHTQPVSALTTRVRELLENTPEAFLRTSNEERSRGLHLIQSSTSDAELESILGSLSQRVTQTPNGDTKLIFVERIPKDMDGMTRLYRAHFMLGHCLGGYAIVSPEDIVHVPNLNISLLDEYVAVNELLYKTVLSVPAQREKLWEAISVLGCNIGAVEFFIKDGSFIFLEVNCMWGHTRPHGSLEFEAAIKQRREDLSSRIPHIYEWLDAPRYYQRMYDLIANEVEKERL